MKVVKAHEVKSLIMRYCFYERGAAAVITEGLNNADVLSLTKDKRAIEFEVKTSRSDLNRELAAIQYATRTIKKGEKLGPVSNGPQQEQLNLELGDLKKKAGAGWSKITKHEQYLDPAEYFKQHPHSLLFHSYMPNYFYLVVPRSLQEYALEQSAGSGYGVIAYDGCRSEDQHYGWFKDGKYYGHGDRPDDAKWQRGAPCEPGRCYEEVTVKRRPKLIHKEPISDGIIMKVLHRAVIENMVMLNKLIELKVDVNALHKKEADLERNYG